MASTTNLNSRVGHWVDRFQKRSTALRLPRQAQRQTPLADSVPLLIDGMQLPSSRRLIVIVPGAGIEYYALAQRLWSLASPERREILLIGVYDRIDNEFQARRNLTSLAAATRDRSVRVQTLVVESRDLLGALQNSRQDGDILLCPQPMTVPGWMSRRNLPKILARVRMRPLYCLDLEIHEDHSWLDYLRPEYALTFLALLSVALMVGILFWLHQVTSGGVRSLLEIIAVLIEASLIWKIANYSH